ncbi:MAG: cytochrome C [Verrucomicrobiaceae bacterium]|nr:cytochrome C [Verrucomicrobiaceae bacterium]
MPNFFPRWTNLLPIQIGIALMMIGSAVTAGLWYYFTPKYTRVGYQPAQPVPFSHKIHVEQHGMDCRYCHNFVEKSGHSNLPSTATCMNCHKHIKKESPKLAPVRESWKTGKPIEWVNIHEVPDYAYFNHSVHVNRGVSCVQCHGRVDGMEVVYQDQPQSMSWCLDCHRAPEKNIRPVDELLNFDWKASDETRDEFYGEIMERNGKTADQLISVIESAQKLRPMENRGELGKEDLIRLSEQVYGKGEMTQEEVGLQLKEAWNVNPPLSCSACHR